MTDHWDFYALRVDGAPASIFVDLGLESNAPIVTLSHMAYVRLHMRSPRPDGLSSQQEYNDLVRIEDSLRSNLCRDNVAYVGRNTSGGYRDFYFYVSRTDSWQADVAAALKNFEGYQYETGCREDAPWSTYLNFLLPGALQRERIKNRRVCETLQKHGDPLLIAREIDHWSAFPSQEAAASYIAEISSKGFQVRVISTDDHRELPITAQVWRTDVPSYDHICDVTLALYEASTRLGGKYEGWECPVEA